jgi:hypothetical protein
MGICQAIFLKLKEREPLGSFLTPVNIGLTDYNAHR